MDSERRLFAFVVLIFLVESARMEINVIGILVVVIIFSLVFFLLRYYFLGPFHHRMRILKYAFMDFYLLKLLFQIRMKP